MLEFALIGMWWGAAVALGVALVCTALWSRQWLIAGGAVLGLLLGFVPLLVQTSRPLAVWHGCSFWGAVILVACLAMNRRRLAATVTSVAVVAPLAIVSVDALGEFRRFPFWVVLLFFGSPMIGLFAGRELATMFKHAGAEEVNNAP